MLIRDRDVGLGEGRLESVGVVRRACGSLQREGARERDEYCRRRPAFVRISLLLFQIDDVIDGTTGRSKNAPNRAEADELGVAEGSTWRATIDVRPEAAVRGVMRCRGT